MSLRDRVAATRSRLAARFGGAQKAYAALVLAGVLALDSSDRGTLSVVAPDLKRHFSIGNSEIGLLAGAFAVVSALATVPAGVLTDRHRRTLILAVSVGLWAVAMATSGLAVSFVMLLFTRLMFGVVSATAGPTLLSLSGDLFPRKGRGEALGLIRTGDMIGTGLSFMVLGVLVGTIGWRGCFFVMAIPAAVLAFALLRLPEPARTGGEPEAMSHVESARQNLSLWEVARKVLAIRTFRVVLISAFVGDFFFAGISVFLFVFLTHQYHVSRAAIVGLLPLVGVAGLAGGVGGGYLSDRLLQRGSTTGRVWVAAIGYSGAAIALVPAVLFHNLVWVAPCYAVAALGLAAPVPVLDAMRLDVVSHELWGRAESVRTLLKTAVSASGPLLFGIVSEQLGGHHRGLQLTVLAALPVLFCSGIVLLRARRSYGPDVRNAAKTMASGPDASTSGTKARSEATRGGGGT